MDDRFLTPLREDPRPGFDRALRERLRADEAGAPPPRAARWLPAWRPAYGIALGIAAAITAFVLLPSVRVQAQAFLDLFRVRNFVAVRVDPARLERLRAQDFDPATAFGDRVVVSEPGAPQRFADPGLAFAAAGLARREPAFLPDGMVADSAVVAGASELAITVDARKVDDLARSLGITDVSLPPGMDGARITARTAPAVAVRYRKGEHRATLLQAPSPEVSIPAGTDLARLAEVGLRILGLAPDEARRFARTVDWRTTLLVPIPATASEFREVEVNGRRGLLFTDAGPRPGAAAGNRRHAGERTLLWADGERVYAVTGNPSEADLLMMANSLP